MRIARLQLRNFRAFRELDMTFEPATLLVGANDAGKTTIIEAISTVLATGHDIWEHAPIAEGVRGRIPGNRSLTVAALPRRATTGSS
jgi:predicted ATP-dependent endonuclease of OLD family